MKIKSKKYNTNLSFVTFAVISGLTILLFAVLAGLFPYTFDDWAWGCDIGISRLKTFFHDYNGRYLGNLLILALTRSNVLRIICMAVSYYAACYLCYKYAAYRKNEVFLFSVILFFIMPKILFGQTVSWASGYSNYVPPAFLSVSYILIIKNIIGNKAPEYPKHLTVATFFIGLCGALFIENVTIFNVCLAVGVVIYVWVKFKKIFAAHIGFLIGAVSGAVLMFSNTGYGIIALGNDTYRTVPSSFADLLTTCLDNGYFACEFLVASNYKICSLATGLLLILTLRFIRSSNDKTKNSFAVCALTVNFACLFFILLKKVESIVSRLGISLDFLKSKLFIIVLALLFAVSVFAVVQICVDRDHKYRMLLPVLCLPVSVAPLLIVTPVSARCFFTAYFLMMVFVADLFGYIIKDTNYKLIFSGLAIAVLILAVFHINIFLTVYKYDVKRNEFAKLQSDNNERQVVVCILPSPDYVWLSSPTPGRWETRYKLFHGIREDATISLMSVPEFDEYYENYNRK
ncbi:MAG: DUF6056 family protein [bacterium]|nr:DUF6056 family protein [bacterium]